MTKTKTMQKDEQNKSYKKWHKAHPEKAAENTKRWIQNNRERWNAYVREYNKAHPEMVREASKKWRANNPEKAKAVDARKKARIKADPLRYARQLELQRIRYHKRKAEKTP